MKKAAVFIFIIAMLAPLGGCKKQHPVKVHISPDMKGRVISNIAVFPFTSAVNQTEDPDGKAPRILEKYFFENLSLRKDLKFLTPSTVSLAADRKGLNERMDEFLRQWAVRQEFDMEFFKSLAEVLKCEAFLLGTADLWQKDEADFQENASSATYVGATITLIDAASGEVLFQASDEDYLEGLRTETNDRQLVVGSSGNIYKDMGERMYKAPPFEDVALKVAKALAESFPHN